MKEKKQKKQKKQSYSDFQISNVKRDIERLGTSGFKQNI